MRCNHCQSEMFQTEQVVELRTRQTWYECSICTSVHTVSERDDNDTSQRIGNTQRFSASMTNRKVS